MNKLTINSLKRCIFCGALAMMAFSTSPVLAERGGGGGHGGGEHGGGEFHGNGGERGFDHGDGFNDHRGNWEGNHVDVNYDAGFISPYEGNEYYYNDPDMGNEDMGDDFTDQNFVN